MAFDLSTAVPVGPSQASGGFDLATAQPVADDYSPTAGMSSREKFAAGYAKAGADMASGLKQRLDDAAAWLESTVPGATKINEALGGKSAAQIRDEGRAAADETKRLDAPLMAESLAKLGRGVGSAVNALPAAMIPGANTVVGSATVGAGLGAVEPTGAKDRALENAGFGAAAGAAGAGIIKGLAAAAKPVYSAAVNKLLDAGLPLTPGQMLGGAWKRAEEAAMSIPFVGDSIRSAQRRSFDALNRTVANEALAPIGQQLPADVTGRAAVAHVENELGKAYDSVLQRIGTVQADAPFANEITSLRGMVQNGNMAPEAVAQFDRILQNQVIGRFQGQSAITAETMKKMESELGSLSVRLSRDPSSDKQALGDAVQELQGSLRGLVQRAAGPTEAADLASANQGWALFKRLQRAASSVAAKDGMFSPSQYLGAVKAMDKSRDHGSFTRGSALGQDLGDAAKSVMGDTVPDSGTPFRSLMTSHGAGLASAVTASPLAAAYTEPAQNVLRILMTQRPSAAGPVSRALTALTPYGAAEAAQLMTTKRAGEP